MSSHTQGPIIVEEVCGGFKLSAESVWSGHFGVIGCATQRDPHPVHGGGISRETALANATLWAAAPQLLAACEMAVAMLEFYAPRTNESAQADIETIRSALRAAKEPQG